MKLLVALRYSWDVAAWMGERLRRDFPHLTVVDLHGDERVGREVRDAEVFVGWSLDRGAARSARNLRWIHCPSASVEAVLVPEVKQAPILVTKGGRVQGPVVAEHAITLLCALARRLYVAFRHQARQAWGKDVMAGNAGLPREIRGATLGVVGFGDVGSEVGRRAVALGMRLLVVRNCAERGAEGAEAVFGPDRLDGVLAEADYVVLAAPLTEATRHLLNAARLARAKPGLAIINVSRGALVEESALVAGLLSGRISAAALDVFEREPLPQDSPLWQMENVLITPHIAALSDRLWERHYALLHCNLKHYLGGEPLEGLVDKQRAY